MSPSLQQAFEDVERLNSWVRSESFRSQAFTSLRQHIYAVKLAAIAEARTNRLITSQRIHHIANCRTCDGTGRYTEWDHMTVSGMTSIVQSDLGPCRRCGGTGKVQLDFICTEFLSGDEGSELIRWHTPRTAWPWTTLDLGDSNPAEDWAPNKPGKGLSMDEAAGFLLIADVVFPQQCTCDWHYGCRKHYSLHIGSKRDACIRCGGGEDLQGYGCLMGRVRFTGVVCKPCRDEKNRPDSLFVRPVPTELITPNIAAWIEANDALKETA